MWSEKRFYGAWKREAVESGPLFANSRYTDRQATVLKVISSDESDGCHFVD